MLLTLALTLAALAPAGGDPGYAFARSLALAGPRPAAGAAERRAHLRVAAVFRDAGLELRYGRFSVPGRGRSRNVIGIHQTPADCLRILMAHTDSMPTTQGAVDNASGVGVLVALAPRLRAIEPRCDVWLVATGAEERLYTGQPDHLGATALARMLLRRGRGDDLRIALSVDEVGRGTSFRVRSGAGSPRGGIERPLLRAVRRSGGSARWVRDSNSGNSDHREFQIRGLPAAKLGQPGHPCRHEPCDRARLLRPGTFGLIREALERLLRRPG